MVMNKFSEIVRVAVSQGASDIHLSSGHPLVTRIKGAILFNNDIKWTPDKIDSLVKKLLPADRINMLRTRRSVDYATTIGAVRLRINIFNETTGLSLAIRLLPGNAPSVDQLNLHPSIHQICKLQQGLVLVCGATGTGKTTTVAAIIEEINSSRACHIITIEDPIEYRFLSKKAFIQQREIGDHTNSFEQGLLDSLREDPDVIVIGELREAETMRLSINAAESGHLVIATLHATNTEEAIYRLCNCAPLESQDEIRHQISSTLSWLIVQQLTYVERARLRAPLLSILRGTTSVKALIRENNLQQIDNAIQMGKAEGMFTHDRYLKEFLDTRTTFIPPSNVFQPSAETLHTPAYHSSIMKDSTYHTEAQEAQLGKGENIIILERNNEAINESIDIDDSVSIERLFKEYED
jgi:pilus retraction protein PilT